MIRVPSPGWRARRVTADPARASAARGQGDIGQSTVELALLLPIVLLLLLALVQIGMVARDQVQVTHAAREAARAAAVSADPGGATAAALAGGGLDPARTSVRVTRRDAPGGLATVVVEYRSPVRIPVLRSMVGEPKLRAETSMRVER